MSTVLIIDDSKNIRSSLATTFRLERFRVEQAENGDQALAAVDRGGIDLLLMDLQMPGLDGIEVLRRLRERGDMQPVIFLSAHGTIDRAVEAVRLGAFDFLEKAAPCGAHPADRAQRSAPGSSWKKRTASCAVPTRRGSRWSGSSPPMERVVRTDQALPAPTEARVLILGENGSGKELIAREIHRRSRRAEGPFVCVNCAAVPRTCSSPSCSGTRRAPSPAPPRVGEGQVRPRAQRGDAVPRRGGRASAGIAAQAVARAGDR